ncbi:fungal-specific transcription factor domain-containing protein [Desarmillaria tabescens]|uniref:Fungal-specific transcription factor domain-containing protein n=1 Tax=Armillaria tabescens TaxID=1929756 RepID=A0AA39T6I8_ARMTA|nr:fungal-specific transcription factor domain-containing protein [Desarmillaria tabescens]KAK0467906.1 fungal-specific transcription factor domain-containing protein [Desarmillaria tabescens]
MLPKLLDRMVTFNGVSGNHRRPAEEDRQTENTPPSRSSTTGAVRQRSSPQPGEQNADSRPQKRARKAINCEPCRNSKLKCDRNRPCSSCVLRGTAASCYADARGHERSNDPLRGDDRPSFTRVDPAQEFARVRHSLNLLESYVFPTSRPPAVTPRRQGEPSNFVPKKELLDPDVGDGSANNAPGMLASSGQGGLYAGPTSAATHLLAGASDSDSADSRHGSQERTVEEFSALPPEYDRDLLAMLPSLDVIDGLITFYFECCNWVYRHVNEKAFSSQWDRFKSGKSADRIVLATACVIMGVAAHYLPSDHQLLEQFSETPQEQGNKFFDVSQMALQRRHAESKKYNIELVELLLIQGHYLTLAKTESEQVWQIRGELVTIGTALGLHRDPGRWRMHRDVAERRRWAWWHIILLERWQAFMFGRPICIASHHFDTQLPSYCDPAIDKTGRLYLPNIALFRLAYILGDIMDDAVSIRPVPYESVQANDRALTQWMDSLPAELDLDEYRVARNLASTDNDMRRQGVQSVIIRTSYYHIRFTLHRPYAACAHQSTSRIDSQNAAESLEISVSAADKLITMVGQSRPDFLANSSLAVPGHMNWGTFHCFSAAMFFSFQLIANPDQPGAGLFRASIRKALSTLEQARGSAVADKAFDILQAISPLYSGELTHLSPEDKEKERGHVLSLVRKLAFPYHDSHGPRRYGESVSSGRGSADSPAGSSVSPPMQMVTTLPPRQYDPLQAQTPNLQGTPQTGYQGSISGTIHSSPGLHLSPSIVSSQGGQNMSTPAYQPDPYILMQQQQIYGENSRYNSSYGHVDDTSMWGAAVGFGQGEWTQFLEGMSGAAPNMKTKAKGQHVRQNR